MSQLRQRWITLILHTTAFIHRQKELLLTTHAVSAFFIVLRLIGAEIFLALISIPLYVTTSSHGAGEQNTVQYRVRRIATLTILVSLLIVWLLKLTFSLATFYLESSAYSVRDIERVVDVQTIIPDIVALPLNTRLSVPTITSVTQSAQGAVTIRGTAQPQGTVVVSFERESVSADPESTSKGGQLTLYVGTVDRNGQWEIIEDHARSLLQPGVYSVSASMHDEEQAMRSGPSVPAQFILERPWWNAFAAHADSVLNIAVIGLIVFGVLVTILIV